MKQRINRKILKAYGQWDFILFKLINGLPVSWKELQFKLRYPKWKIDKALRTYKKKMKQRIKNKIVKSNETEN